MHNLLIIACFCVCVGGCDFSAYGSQARQYADEAGLYAHEAAAALALAEQNGADSERVAILRQYAEKAALAAESASQVASAAESGDSWWARALAGLSGAVGAAALFIPKLRGVQRGLAGAVRLVDALKPAGGIARDEFREVARSTISPKERIAIKRAREIEGV